MPAVRFRADALEVMRRVRDTGVGVTVTSHGRPLVHVVPARDEAQPEGLGCMSDTCELRALEAVAFPRRKARREEPSP